MGKISSVISGFFKGSKGITDAGADASRAVKGSATSINGNTLSHNLAKYSLLPAATGVGAGVGVAGFVNLASAGIQNAFGLDFGNDDNTAKDASGRDDNKSLYDTITNNVEKLSGWVIFLGIALAGVLIYSLFKDGQKKGGKKK